MTRHIHKKVLVDTSSSQEHPPQLVHEDDDVDVDNLNAYPLLEDEDYDLPMLDAT